ncbi:formylglycine-generating enzyme family protein [Methylomonas paludis]|uniref:Formylglycine-generating enzyme family protein n=1 Tax=Methylomonas paludis TaxID=1173101 RepID=A0A975MLZ1_9GAMM|nr:formylglycine-generating enzyme family protein [Methylomonas paludis]QWF70321.1 formylglycine-generating enzyme family protein [Methylomonas paludis]
MCKTYIATRQTPLGVQGWADLLKALHLANNDTRLEASFAEQLGFEKLPEQEDRPDDDFIPIGAKLEPKPQQPEPATDQSSIFHPYYLHSLQTVVSSAEWLAAAPDNSAELGGLTQQDQGPWRAKHTPPPHTPIVPWTRLWPKLRQLVAVTHAAGLDMPLLIKHIAQGEALRVLPRRRRSAWPAPLIVVLDFSDRLTPYWQDWQQLRRHLQQVLHGNVRFFRLNGLPTQSLQVIQHGIPQPGFSPWPKLSAGDSLLLVSDLGMVDAAHPWPRQCWQNRLSDWQRQGVVVSVLAPVAARHLQAELLGLAKTVRLSPDSSLRALPRLLPSTQPQVTAVPKDRDSLLSMMAVASRVEPGLLRELRRCLPQYGQDAGLEGEVWCFPQLDTAASACALSPWAVQEWREKFAKLPEALQARTLTCLRAYHAGLPQAICHEETLVWHYLANKSLTSNKDIESETQQAREFFLRLKNTLQVAEPTDSAGTWALQVQLAGHHLEWVGPTLKNDQQYKPYLATIAAAIMQAKAVDVPQKLPGQIDPVTWLQGLPVQPAQTFCLRQNSALHLELIQAQNLLSVSKYTSRLADIDLDRQAVLLAWRQSDQTQDYFSWFNEDFAGSDNIKLNQLLSKVPAITDGFELHTGRHRLSFQRFQPPKWASGWGQDQFGLYADLKLNQVSQRLRWIAPGTFMMGSPESEVEREIHEIQHEVTLTKGYWLADTACTQAMWREVMGDNPSVFKEFASLPVESVSWDDVEAFLQKLDGVFAEQNLQARLPTDAEWEYACRAGTSTPFAFGENINSNQVNYDGNYPYVNGEKSLYRGHTVPVKTFPANAWGLYEMHGNVWEWCDDWYGEYDLTVTTDPPGASEGVVRVMRGGSWRDDGRLCRSACRLSWQPDYRYLSTGFRLALNE